MHFLLKDTLTPYYDRFSVIYDSNIVSATVPKIDAITSIRKNEAFRFFVFFSSLPSTTEIILRYYDSQ